MLHRLTKENDLAVLCTTSACMYVHIPVQTQTARGGYPYTYLGVRVWTGSGEALPHRNDVVCMPDHRCDIAAVQSQLMSCNTPLESCVMPCNIALNHWASIDVTLLLSMLAPRCIHCSVQCGCL